MSGRRAWPRLAPGLGVALAVLGAPSMVGAQTSWPRGGPAAFEVQLFQPSPSPRSVFALELPSIPSHLTFTASVWANYAHTVMVRREGDASTPVVQHAAQFEAQVSLGLFEHFELGLAMPLVVQEAPRAHENRAIDLTDPVGGASAGDLRAYVKLPILRGRTPLALRLEATFPTGDDRHFAGNGSWTFAPSLAVARAFGPVTLAANLGVRLRERNAIGTFEVNDEALFGFGVRWRLGARVELLAEAVARAALDVSAQNYNGSNALSAEARVGAEARLTRGLTLLGGLGRGLTAGYGSPDVRAFVGLRLATERALCAAGPEDYDGFQDGDFCADTDNDRDGLPDADDRCPNDPEDRDGVLDTDGCNDPDNDGDGVLDADDRCPIEPEDRDGFQDGDGCPEGDNDRDNLPDVLDTCPNEPEDADGFQDDDGCPEPGPEAAVVTRTDTRLLLSQRIFFEFDSDRIRSVSFPILNEVGNSLRLNADIQRLRVEGYTDAQGSAEYNTDLSFRRARAVVDYLVSRGVERERLEFQGYGVQNPVAPNDSPEGQALNRRVEFTIVRQGNAEPAPSPTTTPGRPDHGGSGRTRPRRGRRGGAR